jgi:hypothetical protein
MLPATLIAHLENTCPLLKKVGGSADFGVAETALRNKLPAAFVIPLAEQASPNSSATTLVSQKVNQQFGVILAVSNLRDATGEKALADLAAVRQQVFAALLGWIPLGERSAMELSGGNLQDMSDQVLWWQDVFNIDTYLRSA